MRYRVFTLAVDELWADQAGEDARSVQQALRSVEGVEGVRAMAGERHVLVVAGGAVDAAGLLGVVAARGYRVRLLRTSSIP